MRQGISQKLHWVVMLLLAVTAFPNVSLAFFHRNEGTIEEKFRAITQKQKDRYGIVSTEWLGTHGFIVGCHDCEGALYNPTGALTNPGELGKIPTSWTIRIPLQWNGRVVVVVPPGNIDQAAAFNTVAFLPPLLDNQYAVAIMNHPSPGYPGFPYLDFSEAPYSPREYHREYLITSYIFKALVWEIFDRPEALYGMSTSRGTSLGLGMFLDDLLSPLDGFLVATGGDGYEGSFAGFQEAYRNVPSRLPLTGIPPLQTTAAQKVARLLFFLEAVDPEYRAYVLSDPDPEEQLERALAYDISEQPRKIQIGWASIAMGTRLRKPTIVLQGLRERTVPLSSPLGFFRRVEKAGRADLLRIYLVKDSAHVQNPNDPPGIPNSTYVGGLAALDAWVRNGTEPGPLNVSPFTPGQQLSCTARGLNSLDCFCETLEDGVGGFCSEDPNVACMTANPAKPFLPPLPLVPDDTCAGLGVCEPVVPPECSQ